LSRTRNRPTVFHREPTRAHPAWLLLPLAFLVVGLARGGTPLAILGVLVTGLATTLVTAGIVVIVRERRKTSRTQEEKPTRTDRAVAPVPDSDLSTVVTPVALSPMYPGALLSDLLVRLRNDYGTLANLHNVVLDFRMNGGLDRAPLDVPLLHFVLDRLVSNALRHAPGGSIVEIRAVPNRDARIARIAISDDGESSPADPSGPRRSETPRAQDSSIVRADSVAECRRRIEFAGGRLSFETRSPRGTRVLVELPIDASFLGARRVSAHDDSRSV
jgi:K+-sensing histidine kinase KdpD